MSSAWSIEQRRVLGLLGIALYERAGTAPVATPGAPLPQALTRALRRAAGLAGDEALPFALPPADTLRTPAGKRALWPALRTLRKGRG